MKEMTQKQYDERFDEDIKNHQMKILHDEGVYRHIRFKQPDTGNMYFDLVTYPGYLVYSGDMGDFSFSRTPDMFKFFNSKTINLGYWSEKLQSVDAQSAYSVDSNGYKEWSEELFWENLTECLKAHFEDDWQCKLTKYKEESCVDANIPYEAVNSVLGYDFGAEFDFWEYSHTVYTFRIQWALRAIRWGVEQYITEKGGLK